MATTFGFSRSAAGRISRAVQRVEKMPVRTAHEKRDRHRGRARRAKDFPALITGTSGTISTNRWKYTWSEAEWDAATSKWVAKTGGRNSTDDGLAANTAEQGHTATFAWGVDTTGADYPAGFAPRPVGGAGTTNTHKYDVVARMRLLDVDAADAVRAEFSAFGSHDGTCEEAA